MTHWLRWRLHRHWPRLPRRFWYLTLGQRLYRNQH